MEKIINAHCHIYPEKIASRAVEGIRSFYKIDRGLSGTTAGLVEDGKNFGVVHYLVHSVATKPEQVRSINEFIASEMKEHPDLFTGYGTLHPDSADLEGDFIHLKNLGLKGVKIHPDFQSFSLEEEKAVKLGRLVRDGGLPLLTHCGDRRYRFSNPDQLISFLKAVPGLCVIGAHLGGWGVWDEAYRKLAGKYDILVDCCSSLYYLEPDEAVKIIRAFGTDRVLWGTDYPMWTHAEEMERFNRLDLEPKERASILYGNAAKLLGIRDPGIGSD